MILKLKDRTTINITEEQATTINQMLVDKVEFIQVNGQTIGRGLISGIFKGGLTEADIPNFDLPALEARKCKAQYSIQKEINRIALAEGKNWAKLIKDKTWREQTRAMLWQQTDQWCDDRKGTCACE